MAEVSTSEPSTFRAGDTVTWRKTLDAYPAPTWTLAYRLLSTTGATDITVTADGATHVATLTAAQSALLAAGDYTLVGSVSAGTERYTVFQGQVRVLADLAASTTFDGRSQAQQDLEALQAGYRAWQSASFAGRKSISISTGGSSRSMEFETPAEMIQAIEAAKREVAREKALESAVNYGVVPGRIQVRM